MRVTGHDRRGDVLIFSRRPFTFSPSGGDRQSVTDRNGLRFCRDNDTMDGTFMLILPRVLAIVADGGKVEKGKSRQDYGAEIGQNL